MTKKIRLIGTAGVWAVLMVSANASASAFGFKAGMTADQIIAILGKSALKSVTSKDVYTFQTAPNPYPSFENYICIISPQDGLLKVVAVGKDIDTNGFGESVKSSFEEVAAALTKAYGPPARMDFLRSGSIWDDAHDWMMGLLKKDRTLECAWLRNCQATDNEGCLGNRDDRITVVSVEAKATSDDTGYLVVTYEFDGWEKYANEKQANRDTAF